MAGLRGWGGEPGGGGGEGSALLFGLEAWVDAMLSSARASEAERRAARAAGRGWRS